jgi:hypothetical protein
MKHLKMLGLTMAAIAALMAFAAAGSASANTVLCEKEEGKAAPAVCENPYLAHVIEASSTKTVLESNLGNVTCTESSSKGRTKEESGNPLKGEIEELNFKKCTLGVANCTATAVNLPYAASLVHTEGTFNGVMTVSNGGKGAPGATVICAGVIECTFTAEGIQLDANGGATGTIVANKEKLGFAGGAICPKEASWTATYSVSNPKPVFIANG